MALELPRTRITPRQIQIARRRVPLEQILAVQGQSPVATGIETLGNVIGQSLTQRAALRKQGEQLARLESLSGQPAGTYSGLDPSTATSLTTNLIKQRSENFNPDQLAAISSGDVTKISAAFPNGVPREAASLAATSSSKELNREAIKIERETKREQQINKDVLQYSESLEKNPIAKKIREQGIGLNQMTELVDLTRSGNTVAASAMGTKAARAMGEVGVLTETDIKRYVQSGRLDRKAADTLSRWTQGKPTNATLNEISQIANVLNDSFDQKIQPIHNTYVERLSRNYNLTPEEAAYRLAVDYKPVKKKQLKNLPPAGSIDLGNGAFYTIEPGR